MVASTTSRGLLGLTPYEPPSADNAAEVPVRLLSVIAVTAMRFRFMAASLPCYLVTTLVITLDQKHRGKAVLLAVNNWRQKCEEFTFTPIPGDPVNHSRCLSLEKSGLRFEPRIAIKKPFGSVIHPGHLQRVR